MSELTDLHCHILPGIDDGAQDLDSARRLLAASAETGVKQVVFTPHFYPERISPEDFLARRLAAVEQLRPVAVEMGVKFRVGAEVQFTPVLASMPLEKLAFSGTGYLLLEMNPIYEPYDAEGLICRLRDRGYTPILAHVERFPYIENDPTLLYRWVKAGALGQVNAGWYLKDKGARKRLDQLLRWNLVHIMASDTHSLEHRPPLLDQAMAALPAQAAARFRQNSEAIFRGERVLAENPIKPRKGFGGWK